MMDYNTLISVAFNKNCTLTQSQQSPLRKVLLQRTLWVKLQNKFAASANIERDALQPVLTEEEIRPRSKRHQRMTAEADKTAKKMSALASQVEDNCRTAPTVYDQAEIERSRNMDVRTDANQRQQLQKQMQQHQRQQQPITRRRRRSLNPAPTRITPTPAMAPAPKVYRTDTTKSAMHARNSNSNNNAAATHPYHPRKKAGRPLSYPTMRYHQHQPQLQPQPNKRAHQQEQQQQQQVRQVAHRTGYCSPRSIRRHVQSMPPAVLSTAR
ncbi:hypothetical protein PTSG_03513 [Salpingoeca rosetta]|uniref:Uncharacterized protein n=1 Tax=Salpingoeca rosetta (strain ATCC 50818 / BSB-021) TaxID=946362 RepID=F2U5U2_SALR5|nr:uncharacterized protein PTSG_03513 [Salpingoeca rosetta]EGD82883.1 hypothetical protein PTSG_03513 [Salpingoeca rosetta]|eukprot:XP_004995247.1 hypothetical protein PTSG_03513 [Salpingoeca rosetta]